MGASAAPKPSARRASSSAASAASAAAPAQRRRRPRPRKVVAAAHCPLLLTSGAIFGRKRLAVHRPPPPELRGEVARLQQSVATMQRQVHEAARAVQQLHSLVALLVARRQLESSPTSQP